MKDPVLNPLRCRIRILGLVTLATLAPGLAAASPAALSGELSIGGTGAALGTMQKLADEFSRIHPGVRAKILPSLGSGGGIKALIAGQLSLSVSGRPVTDAEKAQGVASTEFARTPFVFATALRTPVDNVTLDDLAGLYSGRIDKWSDGTLVRPVLRPNADVDSTIVRDMSEALGRALAEAHQRPGKNVAVTDTDIADELEKIPGAIGTSTTALIASEGRKLKILNVNGVEPTLPNLSARKYPYFKAQYLVMPANPTPVAAEFARFIASPAGRAVLARTGNLPSESAR